MLARWLEYFAFLAIVVGLAKPAGVYLARVFEGQRTWLDPVLRPVELLIHRVLGVRPDQEMSAALYFLSFVLFALLGVLALFALLMCQLALPSGPADHYLSTPMTPDLALNTAISFATTTTWQAYAGESTMRYLTQAVGLVSQNFLAGAAGLAVGIAFIRGMARTNSPTIGNFWSTWCALSSGCCCRSPWSAGSC
jgi:K+-transporting ATPase ATPase A chain